jgi:hypothetical protein
MGNRKNIKTKVAERKVDDVIFYWEEDIEKKHYLILQEMKDKLKDQLDSIDSLDNKAGLLLGFESAVFIGFLLSGKVSRIDSNQSIILFFGLTAAILLSLLALLVGKYWKGPEPSEFLQDSFYKTKKHKDTLVGLIKCFEDSYAKNIKSKKLTIKAFCVNLSLILQVFSLLFLGYVFIFFK